MSFFHDITWGKYPCGILCSMEYVDLFVIFAAVMLIFVAGMYAFFRVLYRHERKHHVRHTLMLIGTSLGAWYSAHFLKAAIGFPRPDLTAALFQPVNLYSNGMPSGHAAFMFALAATMYSFDRKAGRVLYLLAIATGIARTLSGVHYWYDIVGGAVLGYAVSWIVVVICKRVIRS